MKRYVFPLMILMLLFAVVALAAPGDKRPAVTSAAIGLGTSSSPTLASITATTSVTAPAFTSSAADGYHYIMPYNSIAFAGTPLVGMIQTTPTGPQWYTGSAWEAIGSGGDSLPTQTGNSGKYLTTNGTAASWGTIAAGSGIAISADIPTEAGAANLNDSTHVLTVASSTGYTQFTGSFTAWDTTPDAFSFTDETNISLSTAKTSNAITVAGTNYPAAISVTGDTGYGYSKNSAACTATIGTVVAGDTVAACVTSSGSNSTATTTTVTIGGVSDTYSVTTVAGDLYTSYFSNDFGCSDSGTVYSCASQNAFTSETDTASIGGIANGKYVLTYGGVTTSSYVQANSLTSHQDISLRARVNVSNTTLFSGSANMTILALRDSASGSNIAIQISASSGGGELNQWRTTYPNGSNTTTTTTAAFTFVANVDYDVVADVKFSSSTSSADGIFKLTVNGTVVQNLTGINTYKTGMNQLQVGSSSSLTHSATGTTAIDNVVLGYK